MTGRAAPLILPSDDELLAREQAIEAEEKLRDAAKSASVRLLDYVPIVWPVLEPKVPFTRGRYIEFIADKLEQVSAGKIHNLVLNVPPGHGKSLFVSVLHPSWEWLTTPWLRIASHSHDNNLVNRDALKMRSVVTDQRYERLLYAIAANGGPRAWGLRRDQRGIRLFQNTATGFRQSTTLGAGVTGLRCHRQLLDDPHDLKDVLGDPDRVEDRMGALADMDDTVLSTRVDEDEPQAGRVLVMQRVHVHDLSGHRIHEDDVEHVCLPLRYDPDHPHACPDDWRRPGELLWPERVNEKRARKIEVALERVGQAESQLQQNPGLLSGGVYQRDNFQQFYQVAPERLAPNLQEIAVTIDANIKATKRGSFFTALVMGRKDHRRFLLDEYRERVDHHDAKDGLRALFSRWPTARLKLVEDKANGSAIVSDLKHEFAGLVPWPKGDDKVSYNTAFGKPVAAAGDLWLPLPEYAPWIEDWIQEMCRFPAEPNDRPDAFAQLMHYWSEDGVQNATERIRRQVSQLSGALY